MNYKDIQRLEEAYASMTNHAMMGSSMKSESSHALMGSHEKSKGSFSLGNELRSLLASLDPKAKTESGALVADVLKDILSEFDDIVNKAKQHADQPDAIHGLLQQLKTD